MTTQIQLRRGTASEWSSLNPTLASGEVGFETDTGKFKVGTGSTAWSSLSYFYDVTDLESLYLTQASASTTYITPATASATYLTQASASTTYATLASPTFTGTVTLPTGTVTSGMILDGAIVDGDISASASITQSKISGMGAWTAYTPTLTNFTLGTAGTTSAYYTTIGKTVIVRIWLRAGTSPTITGAPTITLPSGLTAASYYSSGRTPLGTVEIIDGATYYGGHVRMGSTSTVVLYVWNVSGSYASDQALSSTVPATSWWTKDDDLFIQFIYEAA